MSNPRPEEWHLARREAELKRGEHTGWTGRSGSNHGCVTDHMRAGAKTLRLSTSNPASSEALRLILAPLLCEAVGKAQGLTLAGPE